MRSWRDGGLTILDVKDKTKPELIVHRNWCPPYGGGTHSALPLHDRDLLVVADEATLNIDQEQMKRTWIFDIREKTNPDFDRDDADAVRPGLRQDRRPVRAAQSAREPAWIVPVLDDDFRDVAERRGAGVRHRRSVSSGGDRLFRAAAADQMDGTVTRPSEGASHGRSVRGGGWIDVRYRLRCRVVHPAMEWG